jgi:hypothetical protein
MTAFTCANDAACADNGGRCSNGVCLCPEHTLMLKGKCRTMTIKKQIDNTPSTRAGVDESGLCTACLLFFHACECPCVSSCRTRRRVHSRRRLLRRHMSNGCVRVCTIDASSRRRVCRRGERWCMIELRCGQTTVPFVVMPGSACNSVHTVCANGSICDERAVCSCPYGKRQWNYSCIDIAEGRLLVCMNDLAHVGHLFG